MSHVCILVSALLLLLASLPLAGLAADDGQAATPLATSPATFHTGGLSPQDAVAAMTVPDGFKVELVAGEPRLHQPIAFAIDARGRLWIAQGHTYPLRVKGASGAWNEGKDRIIILEDAEGNGSFETRKVFAENINLVSGLEVGFGGVWVGAAPYLLFFSDGNGDDRPDGDPEILLDGFGFHDTHETLNSFIWGPDGWLYGCHGVFTHSRVGRPGTADADRVPLNAGYWRYHPTGHRFEVFARGTSNPWGIDFDGRGQAFATACVIPHLYHVIQGARYQRQGGRHFNPHIYEDLKTIADHRHYAGKIQDHAWWGKEPRTPRSTLEAGGGHAHCGALVYLGDNFPPRYRGRLFMNNVHGNRVNTDILERRGSGFVGRHGEDLLIANNAWFRGIDLQYGPDGGVFLIDWYDRNACHRTQPLTWDRSNGRMYKITYGETEPRRVDLASLTDVGLARLQLHPNDWYARTARRVLQARDLDHRSPAHRELLAILRDSADETRRLRALWTIHAATGGVSGDLALELLENDHEYVRAWTIQCIAEDHAVTRKEHARLVAMSRADPSPVVRLYLASSLQRLALPDRFPIAAGLLDHPDDEEDHNLPLLIWYGVESIAATSPKRAMDLAAASRLGVVRRFIARRVASNVKDLEPIMAALSATDDESSWTLILREMLEAFRGHVDIPMPGGWTPVYETLAGSSSPEVRDLARALSLRFGDRRVFAHLRKTLANQDATPEKRRGAMRVLLDGQDGDVVPVLFELLSEPAFRGAAIRGLAGFANPDIPAAILAPYGKMTVAEKRDAVNTLSSRPPHALKLLAAVRDGVVPRKDLTAFTIRQLRSFGDEKIDGAIRSVWGVIRKSSADKVSRVATYRKKLGVAAAEKADRHAGRATFNRVCAQCHTIFGSGTALAPDLTGSNRADLDYILENLVDPNAVVGKDYQMQVLVLRDGRVVSGLILKETESAVTLKTVNEEVVVPRKDLLQKQQSTSSLMPEGLLDDLADNEVRDLIAYLASPTQVFLPGATVAVDPETHRVAGAIEGEKLQVVTKTRGVIRPQRMAGFGKKGWSDRSHLWWTGARPEDHMTVTVPVKKSGTYLLDVALTRARDYGIVQLWWDGEKIESPVDLYNPRVVPTGTVRLGEVKLEAGDHRLGVTIVGANPKAVKAHMFGLDYVLLTLVE